MIFNFFYLIWNTYSDPADGNMPRVAVPNMHSAPPAPPADEAHKTASTGGAAEEDGLSSARGKESAMLPMPPAAAAQ